VTSTTSAHACGATLSGHNIRCEAQQHLTKQPLAVSLRHCQKNPQGPIGGYVRRRSTPTHFTCWRWHSSLGSCLSSPELSPTSAGLQCLQSHAKHSPGCWLRWPLSKTTGRFWHLACVRACMLGWIECAVQTSVSNMRFVVQPRC
jgi:hypothetical protein